MAGGDWMAAMLRDDLHAAWAIADSVLRSRDPATQDDTRQPYHERWVWNGEDLAGRDVVVRCYHGLGDTLQFIRFLPLLRARHVTLEVQPELLPLLGAIPGVDRFVAFDPARPIAGTHAIEIMELQHALRAEPPPSPSLAIRPDRRPGVAVGVCWQAGGWDPARSIPLEMLRPVLPPGVVSLVRGASGLPDPLEGTMDIAATAGLIASLDRVITVDTMVAHLAGVLGRPVHLLLKHEADWRWGLRTRTPWYPTMHIHRQQAPGDWAGAVASLQAALRSAG
jgi:hypothetical protein